MADNIKIVGSILGTSQVSRYTTDDLKLITSLKVKKSFNTFNDYIEYHVYNIDGQLLENNYNYRGYKLPTNFSLNPGIDPNLNTNNTTATGAEVGSVSNLSTTSSTYPIIEIDPVMDLENLGYTSGEFKVQYNIFKNKISKFPSAELFIKEISPDRTEIRVGSVVLTDAQLESGSLALINSYNSSSVFDPFLLNFSDNKQSIATNIALNKIDTGYEILFKLYTELDVSIIEKSSLWVVEEISTPYVFDINLDTILSSPKTKKLKGPNFNNISRFGLGSTTTPYSSNFANNQEGLFNLNNSQSIDININYSGVEGDNGGYSSFVNFGSAESRVQNFFYKLKQIETGSYFINKYTPYISTTSSLQSEINLYSSSINDIISNFDGFENYLYFESGSLTSSIQYGITPFPKSNSLKPYTRQSSTSSNAITWYSSSISNAEDYDSNNVNYFKYSVPGYLIDDSSNENYVTFLNMMGQYFDNIWIYVKSITDRNLSNNNLNIGISKDVVYNLLQSLGVSIFNSFGDQSIANYLLGANTGSYSYSGSLTNFSATSSYLNNIPKKDILAESYKRIYHNLPLLLQRKGTVAGLRTLLSTFGIPNQDYFTISGSTYYTPTGSAITSSVLNVKEFGGSSKAGMLAGYNNDKVRIINNITASVSGTFGNVLSPYSSITQYTTASSNFRTVDENYVDISFSPQSQIDTYISKSISSNNSSWVVDDYIGDPRQLYSGSYNDLITQRNIYFGGTGSFPGFTGSLMDYNGFIRLVQFFDNSMFKMLEDYVPARTSLSTGITINSPALERNKWSYARPNNTTNELEKDGNINAPTFTTIYDDYYSNIPSDKSAYFTGELSGSEIGIYNSYFLPNNYNPWTQGLIYTSSVFDVSSSNPFPIPKINTLFITSASISTASNSFKINGINFQITPNYTSSFITSASISAASNSFGINGINFQITPNYTSSNTPTLIYVPTGSTFTNSLITASVIFNNNSSVAPYSSSLQYISASASSLGLYFSTTNTPTLIYTPTGSTFTNSLITASIIFNVSKSIAPYSSSLQYISASASSLGLYFVTSIPLKKLDYQDFIHSDFNVLQNNVSRSLASSTRQKLEISGSSGILGSGSYALLVTASLQDSYLTLSSYTLPRYSGSKTYSTDYNNYTDGDKSYGKTAAIDRYVRKFGLFTQVVSSSFFDNRNPTSLKYLVDESGSLTELSQTPTSSLDSHWIEIQNTFKLGSTSTVALFDNQQYSDQKNTDGPKPIFDSGYSYYPILYYTGSDSKLYFQYVGKGTSILFHSDNNGSPITIGSLPSNTRYAVTGGFIYNVFNVPDGTFDGRGYYSQGSNNFFPSYSVAYNTNMAFTANFGINFQFGSYPQSASYTFSVSSSNSIISSQSLSFTSSVGNLSTTLNFNVTSSFKDFNPGDQIYFKLQQVTSSNNYTASLLSTGDRTIYTGLRNLIGVSTVGINPFATSSLGQFVSQSNGIDTLYLNQSLSGLKDYLYLPATSSVSLHTAYGNINNTFSPKVGDVILLYYNNNTQIQELNIVSAQLNSSIFELRVSPNLVSNLAINGSYSNSTISKLLLLSKVPDETNINLYFDKLDGQTSYGFLIPDNLSPDVLKNIDTITRQVKQKILTTNQGLTINTV
jgi:hypothetical protein